MKGAADLTLKAGAIALTMMVGCVVGRAAFLLMTTPNPKYLPSAAAIEFLWVAPVGAVPGAVLALAFMAKERRSTMRRLRKMGDSPRLTTDQQVALVQVLELLREDER